MESNLNTKRVTTHYFGNRLFIRDNDATTDASSSLLPSLCFSPLFVIGIQKKNEITRAVDKFFLGPIYIYI